MEIKQHVPKKLTGYWRNQKGNQKLSRNKWQWKHDNSKPMGCSKSSSKREAYSNTILPQETRKTLNRQPNFTSKTMGKRTTPLPKFSRRKEIIKIRAEINEKEMKETKVKINKTKGWFFEKIKKIDKSLARFFKEKKRDESNQQNEKWKTRGYNRQCRNTKDYEIIMKSYMAMK